MYYHGNCPTNTFWNNGSDSGTPADPDPSFFPPTGAWDTLSAALQFRRYGDRRPLSLEQMPWGLWGTTYSLNFLILGFIQGACVGLGIPAAEAFGARDKNNLQKYLVNGAALCAALSALFTLLTTLTAVPLLTLMHTPAELFDDAALYIRIIFLGIPATVLYNYSSSVLRAMGDSRHPFYFLLAASILNIALDWILIVPFHMGVDGAAICHRIQPGRKRPSMYLVVFCQNCRR